MFNRELGISVRILSFFSCLIIAACTNHSLFDIVTIDEDPNGSENGCIDICAVGDLNNDGLDDIVIGMQKAAGFGLVWYEAPAFIKHPVADGNFTTDGQTGDMDGDGDLDIIISNFGENKIVWYENDLKTNKDSLWNKHVIGEGYGHDVEVGDINSDGKLDVAVCDKKHLNIFIQDSPDLWNQHDVCDADGEGTALNDLDEDGDLDIVFGSSWYETDIAGNKDPEWICHVITDNWENETRVKVGYINDDDIKDIVLTVSEGKGDISWFQGPADPGTGQWIEHKIDRLNGAHSLQLCDMDNDGDEDIVTGEMHASLSKRVIVYYNDNNTWRKQVISRRGTHNLRVSDIDNDGDFDIISKNYSGNDKSVRLFVNSYITKEYWEYKCVDNKRSKTQYGKTGLLFSDANRDGYTDIIGGSTIYSNPDGILTDNWDKWTIPGDPDFFFSVDVDGDKNADLIGIEDDMVRWFEIIDVEGKHVTVHDVAPVVSGRTQGYIKAQIIPGNSEEMIFTRANSLYLLSLTSRKEPEWNLVKISRENAEEGVAAVDIDRDGDLDIVVCSEDGYNLIWLENPGKLDGLWNKYEILRNDQLIDRIIAADVNNDGSKDIVITEETQDLEYNAELKWLEIPDDPRSLSSWDNFTIARFRSVNSMSVSDIDNDMKNDIIIAEHTDFFWKASAADTVTISYELDENDGVWHASLIDRSYHSSHLGVQPCDLDNDGDDDLVSMAWKQYNKIHLWINHIDEFR